MTPPPPGDFALYIFNDWTLDTGGPNDNPAQSDLNSFSRADNVVDADGNSWFGVMWTWDDIDSWTGSGQTGDACALLDTDATPNAKANYALCVRITNLNGDPSQASQLVPGSPLLYRCGDKRNDRCAQPVTLLALPPSARCVVDKIADQFGGLGDDGADTRATCRLRLTDIVAPRVELLNVCSYPSGSPNSNPFDCVLPPGSGYLQIAKKTTPDESGHTFNFTWRSSPTGSPTAVSITDNSTGIEMSAQIPVPPGTTFSVSEGALPAGWVFETASCIRGGTTLTVSLSGTTVSGIGVVEGQTTICTFENVLAALSLNVTKTATPAELPQAGGDVTYTITVTNTSLLPVTLTVLDDDKFGDLIDAASGPCKEISKSLTASGGAVTCSFTKAFAPAATDTEHINVVTATIRNADRTATATASAKVTYTNTPPSITVTKTANKANVPETGGEVQYTVIVTNTSVEPVTLTSLTDDKFGDLIDADTGPCRSVSKAIAARGTYTCVFSMTISGNFGTPHVNKAEAVVVDGDGDDAKGEATASVAFTDVLPDITVTKSASPTTLTANLNAVLTEFQFDREFRGRNDNTGEFRFPNATCDTGGPNDTPAHVDLNCFNRADNVPNRMGIQWSWDDINAWTGTGATGDGCALLDTDGNGKANVAVCATITNTPDGLTVIQVGRNGAAAVYLCKDTRNDRCASPWSQVPNAQIGATRCDIDGRADEGFPGQGDDGFDVLATCTIDLSLAILRGAALMNVCSYPSGSPNSNPFDCVAPPGTGFIRIVKDVGSLSTTSLFGFQLSPADLEVFTQYGVQGGVTSGLIPVAPTSGSTRYTLTEAALPANWFYKRASCTTGTPNDAQKRVEGISVSTGTTVTCTFVNEARVSGSVEYKIEVINNTKEPLTLDQLTDDKFGNLLHATTGPCRSLSRTIGGLETYTCTFSKTIEGQAGTSHENTVRAVAKDDEGNSASGEDDAMVEFRASP